jgi:hypothetical protein
VAQIRACTVLLLPMPSVPGDVTLAVTRAEETGRHPGG